MKTFLLFTLSILWLVFSAFAADATPKTITASSSNGSLLWPTNFFSANSNSIWTVLGGGETGVLAIDRGGTGTTNTAGLRGVIGLDAGDPGSMGTNWLTLTTAAEGRGVLGLDVAAPGALGTNLLTQATAGGVRGLVGLDAGEPGALGTNLLTQATAGDARSLIGLDAGDPAALGTNWLTLATAGDGRSALGLGEWATNANFGLNTDDTSVRFATAADDTTIVGVRFAGNTNISLLSMSTVGNGLLLTESDGTTPFVPANISPSGVMNYSTLTGLFVLSTNGYGILPLLDADPTNLVTADYARVYNRIGQKGSPTLHGQTLSGTTNLAGEIVMVGPDAVATVDTIILGSTNIIEGIAGKQPYDAQLDQWATVGTNSVTALGVGALVVSDVIATNLTTGTVTIGATNVVAAISGKQDADAQLDEWASVSTNSVTALGVGTLVATDVAIGATNVISAISGKQATNVVADLTALAAYSGAADSVLVTDTLRGGTFSYAASGYTADGGNVVAAPGKGSGYWVRDNETRLINVRHFGAFGDGTTDDTVAITAAAAECTMSTDVLYFPPGTYPVTNSITVVGGGVTMDAATLLAMWDASTQQPCLVLGVSGVNRIDRKYIGLRVARNTISSWTSTADVGVKIYYHNHSVFEILESVGFTVGVQVHQGHYNRFQLGRIGAAQYGFLVQSVSDVLGWNANNVYGGRFGMSQWNGGSMTKPGISRYAIAFNDDYSYPSHDNVFHGPVVELNHSDAISGSPTSEATILLVEVGNRNLVDCVYVEEATYMLTSSGIARDNVVTYTCSTSMGSNAPYINEGSLYVNTVIPAYGDEQSVARYHIYDSGLLAQRCDQSGTGHSLPPELFGTSSISTSPAELDSFSASKGDIVHDANGGYISLTANTAAFGIRLDARYAKQFWLETDTDTSYHGRVYVRPLTSTFLPIPDDTGTVKGSYGVALQAYSSTSFMGSYSVSGNTMRLTHVFKCINSDISYIDFIFTGVNPMRLRSFAIYSDDPRAAVIPVRQSTEITYSDAAPMAGTWHKGDRIVNTSPDPGEPAGWLCTTAGTFGAAITETANVSSDSAYSFYVVMSADTHTLQVGQYISGTGFNGRINRISADNLTVYLSKRNTAKPGAGQTVTYITPVFEPYGVIGWLATGTAPDGTTRPYAETSDGKAGPVDFGWRSPVTVQRTSLAGATKIVDESGDAIGKFDTGWTVGASWTTNSSAVVNATGATNSLSHTTVTALVGPPRYVTMTLVSGGAWTVDATASLTVTVGGSLMRTFTNADPPSGTMTISGMVDGSTDEVVFTVYAPTATTVSGSFDNFSIVVLAAGDFLHRHAYEAGALVKASSATAPAPYFEFSAAGTHAANGNAKDKVIALVNTTVTSAPAILATIPSTDNNGSWRLKGKVYAAYGSGGTDYDNFMLELDYVDGSGTYTTSLHSTDLTGDVFAWNAAGYFLIGANADTADSDVTINTSSIEFKP